MHTYRNEPFIHIRIPPAEPESPAKEQPGGESADGAVPPPSEEAAGPPPAAPEREDRPLGRPEDSAGPSRVRCTRAIPRQGTSYMAYRGEPLDPDDPLLSFRPVPHKHRNPRRNAIGPARQRAFIAALAASGIVTQAARHIGASMEALYKLRNKPGAEEFRAAWEAAVDRGVARLEDCALARAIGGEERMVVSAGKVLGTEIRHNEALVMFFLRNRRAARFGDDWRMVKPGHPLYERIKAEVLQEEYGDEAEVFDSIDRFIDDMRERRAANTALLEELDAEDAAKEEEKQARSRPVPGGANSGEFP